MLRTLHLYILRDLIRNFVLSTLALTVLVTMGGGLARLIGTEGLDAFDVVQLFIMFMPVAATIVMPIGAMFASAMTFGRMSADNEIVACRAAGINIHRLFTVVVVLGLMISVGTYYSWNYLIPGFLQNVERLTTANMARLATNMLKQNKPIPYGGMHLHADRVDNLQEIDMERPTGDPAAPVMTRKVQHLRLHGVVFVQMNGAEASSYGTAQAADVFFDQNAVPKPEVWATLHGMRSFDAVRGQYMETAQQRLAPYNEIARPMRERMSYLNLTTLRYYATNPTEIRDIKDELQIVRRAALGTITCSQLFDELKENRQFTLNSKTAKATIRSDSAGLEKDGDLKLNGVKIVLVDDGNAKPDDLGKIQMLRADSALIQVMTTPEPPHSPYIEINLKNAEVADDPLNPDGTFQKRIALRLPRLDVPADVLSRVNGFSNEEILDPEFHIQLNPKMSSDREHLIGKFARHICKVGGLITFRSAFAVSFSALILLAAMLGIVFRGGQILTAFGVSCVPGLFIVLSIMSGRNLAEDPHWHQLGLAVMWSVNVILALITGFVATRVLTR